MSAGGDFLGGRPTVLWALALEGLSANGQRELLSLIAATDRPPSERMRPVRQLYSEAGVFEKAYRLVDKHQERAETIADEIPSEELRRLFYYLIDTVLERPADHQPAEPPKPAIIAPTSLVMRS
jgi:geranylgeranyl pyrophosphate synthase